MPALQPCDPCRSGKKTGLEGGQGKVQAREYVWRGVSGPAYSPSQEAVPRGSGRGWGCLGDVWVAGLAPGCALGPKGLSPVQGPYCQARSNCLSSSSSASSTLRGRGSSPAMICYSSGLPRPMPCRAGPLRLASQLTHCSPALTAPLPLLSTGVGSRPGVGSRRRTSLPLPLPTSFHVPHVHSSRPPTSQRPSSGASSPLLCPAEPSLLFTTG